MRRLATRSVKWNRLDYTWINTSIYCQFSDTKIEILHNTTRAFRFRITILAYDLYPFCSDATKHRLLKRHKNTDANDYNKPLKYET